MPDADTSESTQDGNTSSGATSAAGDEFKAITTQEGLNQALHERLTRERAKYADYKDVKAKATRFDELEAANLSENEKTANRLSAADAEVAKVPAKVAEALRAHLVTLHEIPAERAELFLTANDPELLLRQVQELVKDAAEGSKKRGNHVPREGSATHSAESDERETTRSLFGSP